MNTAFGLGSVFLLAVVLRHSSAECPDHWVSLTSTGSCVRFDERNLTWIEARAVCRNEMSDLVIVKTDTKKVLLADAYHGNKTKFWIGSTSDFDQDWQKNWTKLTSTTEMPDLRNYSFETNTAVRTRLCSMQDLSQLTWVQGPCDVQLPFICERKEEEDGHSHRHYFAGDDNDTATGYHWRSLEMDPNSCSEDDWTYFDDVRKFVKINRVQSNFYEATQLCKLLGGELLYIHDWDTQQYVNVMNVRWRDEGSFYWMGVGLGYNPEKADKSNEDSWMWRDGVVAEDNEYTNWLPPAFQSGRCGGIEWDYHSKWRSFPCDQSFYHVCQAFEPCSSRPAILVTSKGPASLNTLENGGVVLMQTDELGLKCVPGGHTKYVSEVKVTCAGRQDVNNSLTDSDDDSVSLEMNYTTHGLGCVCRAYLTTRGNHSSQLFVGYHGPPLIMSPPGRRRVFIEHDDHFVKHKSDLDDEDDITFSPEDQDRTVNMTFQLFSSPRPSSFSLTKNGEDRGDNFVDHNIIIINACPTEMNLSVVISILLGDGHLTGHYTMTVDNGFQPAAVYHFNILVISHPKPYGYRYRNEWLITGAMLIYLIMRLHSIVPRLTELPATRQMYTMRVYDPHVYVDDDYGHGVGDHAQPEFKLTQPAVETFQTDTDNSSKLVSTK